MRDAPGTIGKPRQTTRETHPEEFTVRDMNRHTVTGGFRTYDLLHVAAALVLGCDSFWSFDAQTCRLAKLAGLKTHT